jgi:hypothetical protein
VAGDFHFTAASFLVLDCLFEEILRFSASRAGVAKLPIFPILNDILLLHGSLNIRVWTPTTLQHEAKYAVIPHSSTFNLTFKTCNN